MIDSIAQYIIAAVTAAPSTPRKHIIQCVVCGCHAGTQLHLCTEDAEAKADALGWKHFNRAWRCPRCVVTLEVGE